jgi:hypothetical protein
MSTPTATIARTWRKLSQLDGVSQIELGFPADFLHRPFVRDYLRGGLSDRIKI